MTLVKSLEGLVGARLAETKTSKQQLAERIGVNTTATLNAKLSGASELSLREGQALADFCGVSVQEICKLALERGN